MKSAMKMFLGVLVCLGITSIPQTLYAQSTTGSIYGTVADPTGASIPSATVTAKDVHTGITQSTTTNGSGEYTFTTVKPGDYVVTTTAKGFKTQTQTGVAVASNQNVHVTFALTTGEVTETVEVEAAVTLVDTRESQLAETIGQARFQNLPTLNRSTYDLVQTIPGVTNYSPDVQTGSRDGADFSVNGLPSDMVSYYLDGAYNNTYKNGGGNKVPNPDALQEFRLITSNFDAEFGRSPGAVANVITRSGTSQFHGSAYDYLRNDMFNAKNYFQDSVAPLKQNQFGGTFGGPVPVVKDTFFFLAYEQLILHQPAVVNSGSIIVPTDLERTGDFSASAVKPTLPAGTNCGTTAAPVICPSALDPVAQNLLKFVPHANSAGIAPQQSAAADVSSYQGLARLDYHGFKNHSIEGMYFNTQGTEMTPLAGGNQIVGYSGMINTENQANVVLADNWTVNDRAVNSIRLFYTQNKYVIGNQYQGHFLADLGSTAGEGGISFAPPKFNVNGYFSAGPAGGGPSNISQLTFGGIDTATLIRGHHSLKVGGSYVWNKYSEDGGNTAGGTFAFTNGSSVSANPSKGITGSTALSDFLEGRANTLVQSSSVSHRTHQYDPALYAQDDWQISPRLNLNLGLRWEIFAPHCCEPTTTGTFVAGQQSTVVPQAPLGLVYQGDKGVAPGLFNTSMLNFAPRVGFAYDAYGNGRTSVRGGFGIFYQTVEQFNYGTMNQLPFSLSTTVNLVPNLVAPYGPAGSPYPFIYNPENPQFANAATTQSVTPGTSAPYVYEYNLTVEQQLNPAFAFRLGYVGNATRNNVFMIDANSPVYIPGAAISTAALNCRRPYEPYRTGGVVSSATCAYTGYTNGKGYTFGQIHERMPSLNANFNSLQVSLRGRIGSKFNLLASYVWAKALDYGGPVVDNTDFKKNYGLADTDIRNRFVVSYLYRLPAVKLWGQFGRQVLSGWQVNGITTLSSGNPFTVTSGVDTNRDGANNDRVNIIGDPYTHAKSRTDKINAFINPAAFSIPGFTTAADNPYGNEQRNQLIGPGNINTNLSLFKEFSLFREARFQFRAESFNTFGNVNLNNPRTNYSVFRSLRATQSQITGAANGRILQFAAKLLF